MNLSKIQAKEKEKRIYYLVYTTVFFFIDLNHGLSHRQPCIYIYITPTPTQPNIDIDLWILTSML